MADETGGAGAPDGADETVLADGGNDVEAADGGDDVEATVGGDDVEAADEGGDSDDDADDSGADDDSGAGNDSGADDVGDAADGTSDSNAFDETDASGASRFEVDPERAEFLREIAADVRGDSSESAQVAAILYRVSDLYDPDEETTPEDIYLNVRNILRVKERGGLPDRDG